MREIAAWVILLDWSESNRSMPICRRALLCANQPCKQCTSIAVATACVTLYWPSKQHAPLVCSIMMIANNPALEIRWVVRGLRSSHADACAVGLSSCAFGVPEVE